ncbi:MAG: hypothetical protein H6699_02955 [Myxococcales bacterium]|nr:hypothetical protein [Myxococcales bacterium]
MRLLVLASDGPERTALVTGAAANGATDFTVVSAWDAFMKEFVRARPDCAVLSLDALRGSGPAAVKAADMTLRALSVPAVISLTEHNADERPNIELETEFDHFVVAPVSIAELARAVSHAIGMKTGGWGIVSETVNVAAPTDAAPVSAPLPAVSPQPSLTPDAVAPETETAGVGVEPGPMSARPSAATFFGPAQADASAARLQQATLQVDAIAEAAAHAFDDAPLSEVMDSLLGGDDLFDSEIRESTSRGTPIVPLDAVPDDELGESGESDPLLDSMEAAPVGLDLRPLSANAAAVTAESPSHAATAAAVADAVLGTSVETRDANRPRTIVMMPPDSESGESPALGSSDSEANALSGSGDVPIFRPATDPTGFEATSRPDSGAPARAREVISLPNPNGGSLSDAAVPQVLYALNVLRATGELVLSNSTLERRVVLFSGEPGTVFQVPTPDDESRLLSTFGWTSGSYRFEARAVPEAQFYTFGEPLEFIYRGLHRHLGMNECATALGAQLGRYPAVTDHRARFNRVLGLESLSATLGLVDGARRLDQLMGGGVDIEGTLRNFYYAWLTGAVVFSDAPRQGVVPVDIDVVAVASTVASVPIAGRSRSASGAHAAIGSGAHAAVSSGASRAMSGAGARVSVPLPPRPDDSVTASGSGATTPAAVPVSAEANRETFERLGKAWERVSSRGGYEVFGLSPGCGVDEVSRRFYELVREFHPDRYAQASNPQIRQLAEKIFVHIRTLQSDLIARERSGAGDPATATTLTDSGVQRRRMRAGVARAASSGPSPGVRPTSGAEPAVGADLSRNRSVGDALERLRSRAAEVGAVSGDHARVDPKLVTSVRRLSPEQMIRNAKAATEQGNFSKARELIEMALARGATGNVVTAYSSFLKYATRESRAADAIEILERLGADEADNFDKSAIFTLAGHVCRLEELNKQAVDFYDRACKALPDNESASRWARHLRKRVQEDDKKKPFSSSFLNKLFTNKAK